MSPSSVRKSPRVYLSTRSPCRLTSRSPQKISESNQADQHCTGSGDSVTKCSVVTPTPTLTKTNNSTTPQQMRPSKEHSASNTVVSNITQRCSITPPAHTAKYGTVTPQHRALLKAKGTPKYSPVTESDLQSLMKSPFASVNKTQKDTVI